MIDTANPSPEQIIAFFSERWEKLRGIAETQGLPQAFYPVALPEYDDHRLIDPHLPALKTARPDLWKMGIRNPRSQQFFGIILQEIPPRLGQGQETVQVTYLSPNGVYAVQCQRKIELMGRCYTFLGLPEELPIPPAVLSLSSPEDRMDDRIDDNFPDVISTLRNAYNVLEQLLRE